MTQTGVYVGNDPSALQQFNQWFGQPVQNVLGYLNQSSWTAFDSSVPYEVNLWKATSTNVIWSVPLTVTGSTLEQAATGAFDAHYLKAATALAASTTAGPIYVRVGWEFNGSWMPWSAPGHESAFIAAYQDLVNTFRSVSDRFKFVWDVNEGGSYNPAKAYPGDAYVDVVGMDTYYNKQYDSADAKTAFNTKVSDTYGLQWQQDFAAAHGKATAISEWGVSSDNAAAYVQSMSQWMSSHNMLYENYWNSTTDYNGELSNGQFPTTGAAFQAAFSSSSSVSVTATAQDVVAHIDALNASTALKTIYLSDTHVLPVASVSAMASIISHDASALAAIQGGYQFATTTTSGDATSVDLYTSAGVLSSHTTTHTDGSSMVETFASDGSTMLTVALHGGSASLTSTSSFGTAAVSFVDGNTTLKVASAALQANVAHDLSTGITGFAAGDVIDFTGLQASHAIVDASKNQLTLTSGTGATLATLHLTGDYSHETFSLSSDGASGTNLKVGALPSGADTLSLRVSEDAYQGNAQFIVKVDGQQVGGIQTVQASHAAGQYEDLMINGNFGAANVVTVQFVNDAYGGKAGLDRNLYVSDVSFNGQTYLGNSAANAAGSASGTAAGLYKNGAAVFNAATHTNTLQLAVSEDAYRGDAQFIVKVDGQQIGGVQTAHASHAAGQTQTISLSGMFAANPNSVEVDFINDLYNGTAAADRNLYVDSITINGHTHLGTEAQNGAGHTVGHAAGMFSNGALTFHNAGLA